MTATLADVACDHIKNATAYLERSSIEEYADAGTELHNAFRALEAVLREYGRNYYSSAAYYKKVQKEREEAERKKKAKKSLEQRVVEWAEENLQEGDFVKFIGTRGESWRLVVSIEKTKYPQYHASRVHGNVITWKPNTTIEYAAYHFKGTSSVNGMEKIALVVRNGVEVFNRKSVHSTKQNG